MTRTSRNKSDHHLQELQHPASFLVELPCQIEPEWHETWGPPLAGFPVELVYVGVWSGKDGSGKPTVVKARYVFDPGSFLDDTEKKEMRYNPRLPSEYYVVVTWEKVAARWRTRKFHGNRLIAEATGATFEGAMIQTLLVGLQPNESAE